MRFLRVVAVDEALVDEAWSSVASLGGYYSAGDGCSKAVFRKALFDSNLVLEAPNLLIRLKLEGEYLEIHPVAFGPSVFANATAALEDIAEMRDKLFSGKPICCIIPQGMRGAKRLAAEAGMTETGECTRPLSGVPIMCSIFTWR